MSLMEFCVKEAFPYPWRSPEPVELDQAVFSSIQSFVAACKGMFRKGNKQEDP